MPIILAIEPDKRQAAHVSAIVRHRVGAELILADTTEGALDAIGTRVPDVVLVPALLSPQDDAALAAALRVIAAAAHVRTLTIPVFANGVSHDERGGGLLSRWRRGPQRRRRRRVRSGGVRRADPRLPPRGRGRACGRRRGIHRAHARRLRAAASRRAGLRRVRNDHDARERERGAAAARRVRAAAVRGLRRRARLRADRRVRNARCRGARVHP